jgi:hypothetical protein
MAERLITSSVPAKQLQTILEDSEALYLRLPGEEPGPTGAQIWHRVTDAIANVVEGATVRFGDGTQDATLGPDEEVDVAVATDIGDVPGEGWPNG